MRSSGNDAHGWEIFFTTKDAKSTKFGILIIRNLRVLRELRGELEFSPPVRQSREHRMERWPGASRPYLKILGFLK
jgi:hypothetical protein